MTAAAGIFNTQQQDLADLAALSETFQDECAASTDPVTANHIAVVADDRWSVPLPCAIICTSPDQKADDWAFVSGSNVVIFERLVEAELAETANATNSAEAEIRFTNWLSGVVEEMLLAARNGAHLINLQAQPARPLRSDRAECKPDETFVDYISCRVRFTWGTGGGGR